MGRAGNEYTVVSAVFLLALVLILLDSLIESRWSQHAAEAGQILSHSSQHVQSPPEQILANATVTISDVQRRAQFCRLPIDHNDYQAGFFSNRFWVNDDFYQSGGPVFVYDSGESDAQSAALRYLFRPGSFLQKLLEEFHGIGIVWEHRYIPGPLVVHEFSSTDEQWFDRYYGGSLPFPINTSTSFAELRSLSFEQALADLPYFAQNFSLPSRSETSLTPAEIPWISIGCSYSGLRSAASRELYPDTFFAAYAASAPVQLQLELDTFFDAIHMKMIDRGYMDCVESLHSIMLHLDQLLSDPIAAVTAKQALFGPGAERNINGDIAIAVANVYSSFQAHGITGGSESLESLCSYLEQNDTPLGTSQRAAQLFQKFASWPKLRQIVNNHFNTSCGDNTGSSTCDLGQVDTNVNSISWTWQLCSELGLLVTQNRGASSLVSGFLSLEYRKSLCRRQFPQLYTEGLLPDLPLVDKINHMTGGRRMRPSNTFWTAGQYDPWRVLTPLMAAGSANESVFTITDNIPKCNTVTNADTVFGYVLEDAQHCHDWSVGSVEADRARALFSQALKQWLPCYHPYS